MGRSLGIDLVPVKTCSYNCPFCQVGHTTALTLERREYVPLGEVLKEFEYWCAEGGDADFITLAGAGEPTLHTGFGDVLDAAGRCEGARSALLSNGSLFFMPEVRRAACRADVVKVSLSAWDEESFGRINQPCYGLTWARMIGGLHSLRQAFLGELWVEVFFVPGLNDSDSAAARIAEEVQRLSPTQIQLNTAVRPPAEKNIQAVPEWRLNELKKIFKPLPVIVTGSGPGPSPSASVPVLQTAEPAGNLQQTLISLVGRHPATADELASGLGIDVAAIRKGLETLVEEKKIGVTVLSGRTLYHVLR